MGYIAKLLKASLSRRMTLRAGILKAAFYFGQRIGINITIADYESPIPEIRRLSNNNWLENSEMIGVELVPEKQIELLDIFVRKFKKEYDEMPLEYPGSPHEFYVNNGSFEGVDAEILYCFVRNSKPNHIIEIGCGNSTLLILDSLHMNMEEDPQYLPTLMLIDPYAKSYSKRNLPSFVELKAMTVQEVGIDSLMVLSEGDILFIDSSHTLRMGSDVQKEILEIIPRLRNGVIVHFHDIFLPAEYPEHWVKKKLKFYNEQYLVQAFLAFNNSFDILWAANFMNITYPNLLADAFNSYRNGFVTPGSLWLRRVGS